VLRWQSAARSGRKTDATDAHSVAVVALRTRSLRQVRRDDRTVALRLLADHRDELGAARNNRRINRALHIMAAVQLRHLEQDVNRAAWATSLGNGPPARARDLKPRRCLGWCRGESPESPGRHRVRADPRRRCY